MKMQKNFGLLTVKDVSMLLLRNEEDWKILIFNFVDGFRSSRNRDLILDEPLEGIPANLRSLLASIVEALCFETKVEIPKWCFKIGALSRPWFVAEVENLKAMALVESSVWFKKRNIFVLGNFLQRA